jgi:hypothetical protein
MAETDLLKAVEEINLAAVSMYDALMQKMGRPESISVTERISIFEKCRQDAMHLWSIITTPVPPFDPLTAPIAFNAKVKGPRIVEMEDPSKGA